MSDQPAQRSLRLPVAASLTLLVSGVAAMTARAEVIDRHLEYVAHRRAVADFARAQARFTAAELQLHLTAPPRPEGLSLHQVLGVAFGATPVLSQLVIGLLAVVLVASGRRVAWLPLSVAAMFVAPGAQLVYSYTGWSTGLGRGVSVLVVALAVVPLLVATRFRTFAGRPLPLPVVVVGALGVAVPVLIAFAGPNNGNVPEPFATMAVFGFGVLVAAGSLPLRLLPAALVLPSLALPGVSFAVNDSLNAGPGDGPAIGLTLGLLACAVFAVSVRMPRRWLPLAVAAPVLGISQIREPIFFALHGYPPDLPAFIGPMALTIGLAAVGAAVPLCGPQLLSLWRRATHRGPGLSLPCPTGATA